MRYNLSIVAFMAIYMALSGTMFGQKLYERDFPKFMEDRLDTLQDVRNGDYKVVYKGGVHTSRTSVVVAYNNKRMISRDDKYRFTAILWSGLWSHHFTIFLLDCSTEHIQSLKNYKELEDGSIKELDSTVVTPVDTTYPSKLSLVGTLVHSICRLDKAPSSANEALKGFN